MKIRLKKAKYHENTGLSIVRIVTKYGEFTDTAALHPDEEIKGSEFVGCHIAECRAHIKAWKAKNKETRIQLHALQNLYKQIESCKRHDPKNCESWHIKHQINELVKQDNAERAQIEALKKNIEYRIARASIDYLKKEAEEKLAKSE